MAERDCVLYFGGGCTSGVFGAGVVTYLERTRFYPRIKAVYGGSAGAMNAAYFLARQSWIGSTLYWEEIPKGLVHPRNLPYGILQRLWNGYVSEIAEEHVRDVLDVEYLFEEAVPNKPLDVEHVRNAKPEFYVQVLNVDDNRIEYKTENLMSFLRATVSSIPYCFSAEKVKGTRYADPVVKDPLPVKKLRSTYPDKHIIIQVNHPRKRHWTHGVKDTVEGLVARSIEPALYEDFKAREERRREALRRAEQADNVTLLTMPPDSAGTQFETDSQELRERHRLGTETAANIL